MQILTAAIVIALCAVLVSAQQCPTWFVHEADKCVCGQQINTELQCSNMTNRTTNNNRKLLPDVRQRHRTFFSMSLQHKKSSFIFQHCTI